MAPLVRLRSFLASPRGIHSWRASRRAITAHHFFSLLLFGAVIVFLLLVASMGMGLLSSLRAFVGGEGYWSKSQKDAVYHLTRYAKSGDESDYAGFLKSLAIPLADRQARLELEKASPDYRITDDAFLRAHNHPSDVRGMAMIFRYFRRVIYIDRAFAIWANADVYIEQLKQHGEAIHAEIASGHPNPVTMTRLVNEVDQIHRELPRLEDGFSETLGDAARWARNLLTGVIVLVATLFTAAGLIFWKRLVLRAHAADQRYRYLIDTANDAILITDAGPGLILVANRKAEDLTGIPSMDLIGRPQHDFVIAEPPGEDQELEGRLCVKHVSGGITPVEISASRVTVAGREVVQSILRDVSERRRFESELRQASKMEAVGKLAGGIAHDFNNLLTIISGYGQLLSTDPALPAPSQASLQQILKAADRAASLTGQLLAFSRRQVLQPRLLDLNTVLASLEDMLRRVIRTDIDLICELPAGLGSVKADPVQIEQVILNLVTNARDAMPKGGWLRISTENVQIGDEEALHPGAPAPGSYVALTVSDTGQGMDSQTKERIFEPFFTTKELGRGTGLGLSTIYGVVKQSGGYVLVDSEVGVGTSFRVYLPRVDAEVVPERIKPQQLPRRGHESILLVEDQGELRMLLRQVLERQGYQVWEAVNGRRALEVFDQQAGRIKLVVTDIVMPEMGGLELGEQLRRKSPTVSLLYISGYTSSLTAQHGNLPAGADFLQKPFAPDVLARRVGQVLQKRPSRLRIISKEGAGA